MSKNVNETAGGQLFLVGILTLWITPDNEKGYAVFFTPDNSLLPFRGESAVGGEVG